MFKLGMWLVYIPTGNTVRVYSVDKDFVTVENANGDIQTVDKEDFDLLEVLYK